MGLASFIAWAGIKSRACVAQPGKSAVGTAILGVLVGSAWRVAILRYAGPTPASAQQVPLQPSRAPAPARPPIDASAAQPMPGASEQRISDTGL
ncbi:MAG: hypothetical protein JWO87_3325 [Phycisphaerales bacterium]|nr:hypothetical protein [Phycisphaerales bacterium]